MKNALMSSFQKKTTFKSPSQPRFLKQHCNGKKGMKQIQMFMKSDQLQVKILEGKRDILEAQKLLYNVYILEQNWKIPVNNPSQLRAESGILHDVYTPAATWYGVFDEDTLIGCHRSVGRLNGKFELENYHPLKKFTKEIKENDAAIEVNRLAIQKEYRASLALFELIHFEFQYLLDCGFNTIFTTSSFPKPGNYFLRFGFDKDEENFKYHPDDPGEVNLMYIETQKIKIGLNKLQKIIQKTKSMKQLYSNEGYVNGTTQLCKVQNFSNTMS